MYEAIRNQLLYDGKIEYDKPTAVIIKNRCGLIFQMFAEYDVWREMKDADKKRLTGIFYYEEPALLADVHETAEFDIPSDDNDVINLLGLFEYTNDEYKEVMDCYHAEQTFPSYLNGKEKDNRMFLKKNDGRYLVISRNIRDVFFASQGNEWQSCFSLTSSYGKLGGWLLFFVRNPFVYMVYETSGRITHWSLGGHKIALPSMSNRAWAYDIEDKFYVGKLYGSQHKEDWDSFKSNKTSTWIPFKNPMYETYFDNLEIDKNNNVCRFGSNSTGYYGKNNVLYPPLSDYQWTNAESIIGLAWSPSGWVKESWCGLPVYDNRNLFTKKYAKQDQYLLDDEFIVLNKRTFWSYKKQDVVEVYNDIKKKAAYVSFRDGKVIYEVKSVWKI